VHKITNIFYIRVVDDEKQLKNLHKHQLLSSYCLKGLKIAFSSIKRIKYYCNYPCIQGILKLGELRSNNEF